MPALRHHLERLRHEPEDARDLELLPAHVDRAADRLRDRCLEHVPLRRPSRDASLCGARRRDDGRLVDDAVRIRGDDPVAALAGHARARRRCAAADDARLSPVLVGELVHRDVRPRGDADLGPGRLRNPAHFAHPGCSPCAAGNGDRPRADGALLASTFILYRHANALSNLLEYPVWIASGLVFSTSILPAWTRPISWVLPPYWGVLALRHAALGGEVWRPLTLVAILGARLPRHRDVTFRHLRAAARRARRSR